MGKMTDDEIQNVVDIFVEQAGEADLFGPYEDNSKSLTPEDLRNKILRSKDAILDYKCAAETGDFHGMEKVEKMVDYIFEHTVEDPPVKGTEGYKLVCQKAAEAMKDKWELYRKRHVERLNRPFAGTMVPSRYYQLDKRVSSIMIEVNRSLYIWMRGLGRDLVATVGVRLRWVGLWGRFINGRQPAVAGPICDICPRKPLPAIALEGQVQVNLPYVIYLEWQGMRYPYFK